MEDEEYTEFKEILISLVKKHSQQDLPHVTDDMPLDELGIDSLDVMEIVFEMETKTGWVVEDVSVLGLDNFGRSLHAYVQSRGRRSEGIVAQPDAKHRALITSVGLVTPLGSTWSEFRDNLIAGRLAIRRHKFAFGDLHSATAPVGLVEDFDIESALPNSKPASMDRVTAFALYAARQALTQAGVQGNQVEEICLGSSTGGLETLEAAYLFLAKGNARLAPMTIPKFMSSAPASAISIYFRSKAPAYCISSACSSSSQGHHSGGQKDYGWPQRHYFDRWCGSQRNIRSSQRVAPFGGDVGRHVPPVLRDALGHGVG